MHFVWYRTLWKPGHWQVMLGRSAFGNHSFILGLANYSPWAKSRQMPIFANKVLLWRSQTLSLAYCHWLLSCEEESSNCNRDCMALEVENIYPPILYSSANSWSSPTYHQTLKSFPHLCLSTLECTVTGCSLLYRALYSSLNSYYEVSACWGLFGSYHPLSFLHFPSSCYLQTWFLCHQFSHPSHW